MGDSARQDLMEEEDEEEAAVVVGMAIWPSWGDKTDAVSGVFG